MTLNIEEKPLPSTGEKMPSKDVDELLSSTDNCYSQQFQDKA